MAAITINDLLTKTPVELAGITNAETAADDSYIEEKIMSPMKDLAGISVQPYHKYLGKENAADVVHKNLESLLSTSLDVEGVGSDIDLVVNVVYQVPSEDAVIITNRPNTLYTSLDRNNFYIETNTNLANSYFTNITIALNDNLSITNCVFDNCILLLNNGGTLNSSNKLYNTRILGTVLNVGNDNTIVGSEIILTGTFTLVSDQNRIYNCVFNKLPINPENNLTQEFNVYIESL